MNKELIKWLLFVCGFFCVCFWADIKLSNAIIAFLACLLGGFCYDRIQKDIAQKVADELEKRQKEDISKTANELEKRQQEKE